MSPLRRVMVVANPISGRGRAKALGGAMTDELGTRGFDATFLETSLEPAQQWLDPALGAADVVVVCGGDGAVRLVAPSAARTDTALYHMPMGTENLFAREFESTPSVDALIAALERAETKHVDLGRVNDHAFTLMGSVGFDAEVVHALAERRTGSISHWTYVMPMISTAMRWRSPVYDIEVDGTAVGSGVRGVVIVANCRQYGGRLDPAADASMADGELDVILLPAKTAVGIGRMAVAARRRRLPKTRGVIIGRGTSVRVTSDRAIRMQLDGDPAPFPASDSFHFSVEPAVLPVLCSAPTTSIARTPR